MITASSPASPARGCWPSAGLVLAAPGGLTDPSAVLRLAQLLGLRALPLSPAGGTANAALAQLGQRPPGWLLPMEHDPAADLEGEGCWAERLGAWRQPLLLLVSAGQAVNGPARAYSALLQAERVPLVGLVQLGGSWQPECRRDGLAWLGWLPELDGEPGSDEEQARQALRLQVMVRWAFSVASAAAPGNPAA